MERRQIRFLGRVQGVGFRATARHIAASFAVTGWVKNEPDGSVLAEVQGAPAEIDRFLGSLRERMGALVRSESSDICTAVKDERGFEVRR